jgi:hypothetical protein
MSTTELHTERQAIVTRESFGLAAPRDMRGARLALPPRSGPHDNESRARARDAFATALAVAGLTLDDAKLVDVADELAALRRGNVDAAFVHGSDALQAALDVGAVVLLDLDSNGDERVGGSDGAPRLLAPFEVLDVLRQLGRDAETYRRLAQHTPHERWFRRLSVTDDHDVWLLGWHGRQGVDLHDHGGSTGGFMVLEGELHETSMRHEHASVLSERRVQAGTAAAFGPGHVHGVMNASPAPATSIHVYSPPLSTMLLRLRRPRARRAEPS